MILFLLQKTLFDFNLFRRGGELIFPLYIYSKGKEKKKGSHFQYYDV